MSNKYAKIKRQELKGLVEQEYGLRVQDMHESERGALIYTDKGIKLLKRSNREEGKLNFAAAACEYIYAQGCEAIAKINRTLSGGCAVMYEDKLYVLLDYIDGKVMELKTPEAAAQAGEALAKLHLAAESFIPQPGCQARVDWGKWMEKIKSYANNIKRFRENLEARGLNSKFDKIFMKCSEEYYDKMYKAYLILKNFGYLEKVQLSMKANQITHKQFRKHAVLTQDNGHIFICNMEDCAYDIVEADIADLLESFSGSKRTELAKAALDAYHSIKPLDRKSIKIIQAFLLQPKRFYKVVDKFYGRKKNYTENELLHKLEKSIKREAKKDSIIEFLETYYVE